MTDTPQPSEAVGREAHERAAFKQMLVDARWPDLEEGVAEHCLAEDAWVSGRIYERSLARASQSAGVEARVAAFLNKRLERLSEIAAKDSPDKQMREFALGAVAAVSEDLRALLTTPAASSTGADPAWLDRDQARLALWKAIGSIEVGNKNDDKLIIENLRRAGIALARFAPETNDEG